MADTKQESMDKLLRMIKAWIETESGPSMMKLSNPSLQLTVTICGYKKIILERKFEGAQ